MQLYKHLPTIDTYNTYIDTYIDTYTYNDKISFYRRLRLPSGSPSLGCTGAPVSVKTAEVHKNKKHGT